MKKILVSLPDKAWEIINKRLRSKLGESDSELVRTIVLCYCMEKKVIR